MVLAFDAHDDALGVDRIHDAVALGQSTTAPESRAVTPSMPVPTSGASATSSGTDWRCMFAPISARFASSFSRNGTSDGGDRDKLLRADVDVVDFVAVHQHEVALPTRVDQVFGDLAVLIELDVGLRDGVLVFFPRREVEAERHRSRCCRLPAFFSEAFSLIASAFSMVVADTQYRCRRR